MDFTDGNGSFSREETESNNGGNAAAVYRRLLQEAQQEFVRGLTEQERLEEVKRMEQEETQVCAYCHGVTAKQRYEKEPVKAEKVLPKTCGQFCKLAYEDEEKEQAETDSETLGRNLGTPFGSMQLQLQLQLERLTQQCKTAAEIKKKLKRECVDLIRSEQDQGVKKRKMK